MKRILNYFIFTFIICFPFAVKASGFNYEDTVHYVNNYIYKFPKYNNYLLFRDKLPYAYENSNFNYDSNFKSAGLLSKTEFEISNKNNNTWLSNGLEYWTLSKSSASRHYVVNYTLQEMLDSKETGVRLTEYINNGIGVTGLGTYSEPWQFSEIISLHVNTTNRIRGKISSVSCSNSTMKKETVTLTFTDGSVTEVYLCPENGYKVLSNTCSVYMTKDINNRYLVHDVKKDNLICNVKFTYITNKVTLGCSGCNTAPSPSTLYSSVAAHDLWFTDKNADMQTDKITKLPSKKGYTFKGFYNNNNLIINSSGNIVKGSTAFISSDVSLEAKLEANTYLATYNAVNATSNDHTTSSYVVYDSDLPAVVIPQRTYTVNYNANGGSVSKSSDTISYDFDGYYYNNVKYINNLGYSVHKWDIDSNVSLISKWTGGNITLAIPTRTGHVFEGWTTNSSGTGTVYKGKQEVFNLISGSNTSVTLYAKWTKCAAGTYLSGNSCVNCAAGTYSAAGVNNCSSCAAGKFSSAGASSCSDCAKNKYSSGGASSCTNCPAGQYTTGTGSSSCIGCPSGYTCPTGSDPVICPVGYKCIDGVTKEACPAGYYSAEGSINCTKCPVGYYCPGATDKKACPSGYTSAAQTKAISGCYISVSAGKYIASANSSTQSNCAAGKYTAAHTVNYGSTSSCSTCTAGYYCPGASDRKTCPSGYTSSSGATAASSCYISVSAGKYIASANSSTQSSCAAGKYTAAHTVNYGSTSSCSTCTAGYYCPGASDRKTCPSGYTSGAGVSAASSCYISVGAGKYIASANSSTQSNCAAGKYTTAHTVNYGSTSSCSTCTAGYYCPGASDRKTCPSGYTSGAGVSAASSCYISVGAGKYIASANSSTQSNCAAGKYKTAHTVNYGSTSSCLNCDEGYYSTGGAGSCSLCSAGTYNSGTGNSGCTTCPAGYYCTGGSALVACPSGYTSNAGATASSSCYAVYRNEWIAAQTNTSYFSSTNGSSSTIAVTWTEYFNEYTNQSYIHFSNFQAKVSWGMGVMYTGGDCGETKGMFIVDGSGNKEVIQKMSHCLGDTKFNFLNSTVNTYINLNKDDTNPPWDSKVYNHASDGTLTLNLMVDLRMMNLSASNIVTFSSVKVPITLTDLR